MKMRFGWLTICLMIGCFGPVSGFGQTSFHIVPLGVYGGLDESNLSAYLVAAAGTHDYVCLDAGTLHFGLQKAVDSGVFDGSGNTGHNRSRPSAGWVLRHDIRAYAISHPHLDHVAGLILNSPEDSSKNIYGFPFCLDALRDHYFTWKTWANFGDQGDTPALGKYHYVPLTGGQAERIANTQLDIAAYPLSHSNPGQSTAFILRNDRSYLLYLGDTGADSVEGSVRLHLLWTLAAPLLTSGRLKVIMIECSFPDEQPVRSLFGHLTPRLLNKELAELERLAGPGSLKGFPVVVMHIKPSGNQEAQIKKELNAENPWKLRWIFPKQAKAMAF